MQQRGELVVTGTLSDSFVFDALISETPYSVFHKVIHAQSGQSFALWSGKVPIRGNSAALSALQQRFSQLPSILSQFFALIKGGVDSGSFPYLAFSPVFGNPLVIDGADSREAERRFTLALRSIETYHQNYVFLGDICTGSFWISKEGSIQLFSLLGAYIPITMQRNIGQAIFLAPEIAQGQSEPTGASDVYSCGVLLHHLIAHCPPRLDGNEVIPQLSGTRKDIPQWVLPVLKRCLALDPSVRYQNASELLRGIIEEKENLLHQASLPFDHSKVAASVVGGHHSEPSDPSDHPDEPHNIKMAKIAQQVTARTPSKLPMVILGAFALGFVIAAALFIKSYFGMTEAEKQLQSALDKRLSGVSDSSVVTAAKDIQSSSQEKRSEALQKLVNTPGSSTYGLIVDAMIHAGTIEKRQDFARGFIQRLKADRMERAASVVSQLFQTKAVGDSLNEYELVFRALDKNLAGEEARGLISQSYKIAPSVTLRLVSAAAVDRLPDVPYEQVLQEMVGLTLGKSDLVGRSTVILLLLHPELAGYIRDTLPQHIKIPPSSDLLWILEILVSRRDPAMTFIAKEVLERKLVTAMRAGFLAQIQDRADLPPSIATAVVRGMQGAITVADVKNIGEWYDQTSERLLWMVCREYTEPEIVDTAFNALASRSISSPVAKEFMTWLRENAWQNREVYIKLATALYFVEETPEQELSSALDTLEKVAEKRKLVAALIEQGPLKLSLLLVRKYGGNLNLAQLLPLLGHKEKEMRLKAIELLAAYNDVGVIGLIIDYYDKERDSEVRQKYQDSFWTIKEREERRKNFEANSASAPQ
jgi:serine/threonine protein kinase